MFLRASAIALAASSAFAGSFTSDFSNPAQSGITLVGGTRADGVTPYPAITGGVLALTFAEGGLTGSAFLDDLDAGAVVGEFNLDFKLRIGGGTSDPADGFSIYFGPEALGTAFGEEGPDSVSGLTISFDTFDNGGGEAPAIDVKVGGVTVGHVKFTAGNIQSDTFSAVSIKLHSNGTLDLSYKGNVVYSNLYLPGYTPQAGRFAFGARTGGSYSNHWIDDLSITTTVAGAPVAASIASSPVDKTIDEHGSVSFSGLPNGTPPFAIQWLVGNAPILDATNLTYTIDNTPASLSGGKYAVKFTNAGGSATSTAATLTVTPDTAAPTIASAKSSATFDSVLVTFSEAVGTGTAGNKANYSLDGGLTIVSATVVGPNTVKLVTSVQTPGARYNLTVNNVADTASNPNTIAANSAKNLGAWVLAKGFLKFDSYNDAVAAADTHVQVLLDNPHYPDSPDVSGFVSPFTSRSIFPDDSHESYGASISGFYTPTVSGSYRFFTSSDDASQLFVSSDTSPANLTMVAEEVGCCAGFLEPNDANPPPQTSEPIALVGGHAYYVQLLYKEGGGGDYGQVAIRLDGSTDPLVPVPGSFLSTYANPDDASITISQQPAATVIASENTTTSFSVAATGTPAPLVVQWQRANPGSATFADIAGATGTTYTTPILKKSADDGAKYRVALAVPGGGVTSTEVALTVNIDSTPPTVSFASAGANLKAVTVSFSEAMLPAGLATAANYTIAGLTVSSATAVDAQTVRLVTSDQTQGSSYTVSVTGVKDSVGNLVDPAGNSRVFKSPLLIPGAMKADIYANLGGVLPSDLRAAAKFPNSPDATFLLSAYELPGYGDSYGARLSGFFVPATTGSYVAYMATDDGGELYLSTDDTEANKKLVAREPVWGNSREWVSVDAATDSLGRRLDADKIDPAQPAPNISLPVSLVAGKKYYTEIQYKEGGGGDHGEAKFNLVSDGAPENGSLPEHGGTILTAIDPDVLVAISLPTGQRSDIGSGTTRGFAARVNQVNQIGGNGLGNNVFRIEQQLAGLVDTNSIALPNDGVLNVDGVVNWNQEINVFDGATGVEIGDFTSTSTPANADIGIPGIPGTGAASHVSDNIAAQFVTYVEFPAAGLYTMGVNSDDGFAVYPTDVAPADNLGLYVTAAGATKGYYAWYGGADKGGIFRSITAPLTGKLVLANPEIADTALVNAADIQGNIALISRGVVSFTTKVQNALNAGAIGAVIINSRDPDSADGKFPIGMGGGAVDLPAMMIEKPHGNEIKALLAGGGAVTARIAPDTSRILGSFDASGGRGSSDTLFSFYVNAAGVYPMRMVWCEGGGGANVEWFTVGADGTKVLLNDTANGGLKAWRVRQFVAPITPEIAASVVGTDLVLTFKGQLQSTDALGGAFSNVTATSPLHIPLGSTSANKFYRTSR